jgi:tryptophan-rich sensory protein
VWPRWLADALGGKVSLARAFWVYGLGLSVVYSLIGLFVDIQNVAAAAIYLVIGLALGVVQTIILWRCANNSRFRFLGRLIRTAMIFSLVVVAIVLYVLYINMGLVAGS